VSNIQPREYGIYYYSNFEVMQVAEFMSQRYLGIYEQLDKTGGFFIHRWGDAIVRYAYVNQFGLRAERFSFDYRHGSQIYLK